MSASIMAANGAAPSPASSITRMLASAPRGAVSATSNCGMRAVVEDRFASSMVMVASRPARIFPSWIILGHRNLAATLHDCRASGAVPLKGSAPDASFGFSPIARKCRGNAQEMWGEVIADHPVIIAQNVGAIRSVDSGEGIGGLRDTRGTASAQDDVGTSRACSDVASGTTLAELLEVVDDHHRGSRCRRDRRRQSAIVDPRGGGSSYMSRPGRTWRLTRHETARDRAVLRHRGGGARSPSRRRPRRAAISARRDHRVDSSARSHPAPSTNHARRAADGRASCVRAAGRSGNGEELDPVGRAEGRAGPATAPSPAVPTEFAERTSTYSSRRRRVGWRCPAAQVPCRPAP